MRRSWPAIFLLFAWRIAFAEAPQVSIQPSSVVLGSTASVAVTVRLPKANLPLRSACNTGTLIGTDNPSELERHFTWTPPDIRFPMTALLVFWVVEERSAQPEPSLVRIPLSGRTTLEMSTEPGAQVRVEVAKASFGPRRADRRGRVEIPIEVPPGALSAQVVAEAHGRVTMREAPLDIPHNSMLAMGFSNDPIVRGEPAWLIVAHPALDPQMLDVQLIGGHLAIERTGAGSAVFRISPEDTARELMAKASFQGVALERAEATARITSPGESAISAQPRNHFFASAMAGGFYAGGSNSGAAVAVDGSYELPVAASRLALELEVGIRSASFSGAVEGLGSVHSSVTALAIELALRALAFERGAWVVHGRLGGGALPFRVSAQSDFQPPFTQSGFAPEAFASAQVGYRLRTLELFAELRGGIAPAKTSTLDAQLGGFLLALGARYRIR